MAGFGDLRLAARARLARRRIRKWRHALEFLLARRFGLATREDRVFFVLIPVVGLVAGALGIIIHRLIDGFRHLLWGPHDLLDAARAAAALAGGRRPRGGRPAGLAAGPAREESVSGQGMSTLIEAVALRGGRLRARPVLLRAVAAIATVGSGGSLGREGPMIRLGAMIASRLGADLKLPAYRVKILVGCGAAAGLAAAYNIPIGGALFAMEVILGNFALEIFGPIVVASVISTLLARAAEGDVPIYAAPDYALVSGWEMLSYAGLGLAGALASLVFVFGLRWVGKLFEKLPVPAWVKPPIGLGLVGALALYRPEVLGSGFDTITSALHGNLPLLLLLALPFAKLLSTALTAGSGGSGGLFTPGLFIGAMVGGAWGQCVHCAVAARDRGARRLRRGGHGRGGRRHQPRAALGDHHPVRVHRQLRPDPAADGLGDHRQHGLAAALQVLDLHRAAGAPGRRPRAAHGRGGARRPGGGRSRARGRRDPARRGPLRQGGRALPQHPPPAPVRGRRRPAPWRAASRFTTSSMDSPRPATPPALIARDLMLPIGSVLRAKDRLHRAVEVFAQCDFERLPVVDDTGRFCGLLAKRDLLAIYAQEVLGRPAMLATFVSSDEQGEQRSYVDVPPDFSVETVPVGPALASLTLAEARLPQLYGVRVLEIRRPGPRGEVQKLVPAANLVLWTGDDLVVVGPTAALEALDRGELPAEVPTRNRRWRMTAEPPRASKTWALLRVSARTAATRA